VYDVTKFLKRHPGGVDTLLLGAGRDVTPVFEMYHEFGVVDSIMKEELAKHNTGDDLLLAIRGN
ncbi:sphingolipid delta-4 desaturase, partial [Podila verticillata]